MVRTPPCPPGSPVHHGESQCSGRFSLSPGPDPRVGVGSPHGSLSGAPLLVADNGRPVCYLSKSPLLHLFLALPRSSGDGDGRSPTVLEPPPGLRVPSMGYDSTGPPQAPIVIQSCADSDRPLLASEPWFPDLLDLAINLPLTLPLRPDLLSQPRSRHVIAVSTGFVFMPGDSPAICQGCGILLPGSCSGWLNSAIFLSHQLPVQVVCLSPVVQVSGPLYLSSLSS